MQWLKDVWLRLKIMTILEELHQCDIKSNEYVVKGLKDICYEFCYNK